ncbi:glycosyl hydrolase family 8 [Phaeobacter sp. HF9A]|uniref:glycosyl hydrolase family 8 n=1 Tax=Phaeobacter sp. HF9A TaxID=2721561 RepID=UPI0014322B52|nr:glycosyl hydrolase family 8 [Phaeobacter sp. HF9A]NIZ15506.1 endoglucanase [Phaeobacter sp. HF9A]
MPRVLFAMLLLFLTALPLSADPYYPSASKASRLATLDSFWAQWKATYLREGCGGAYVDIAGDGKATWGGSASNTLTVSEAHGYGMLALVQMAPRDRSARRLFDGFVRFYNLHPAASDPGLMAWNQTRDCQDAPDGGDASATDGDLDIALALLRADQRWGGYGAAARKAQTAILAQDVSDDNMMRLGDWAVDGAYGHSSRASDFMPASFAAFAAAGGSDARRWRAIRDRGYSVWTDLSRRYAGQTGLVPDFLVQLPDHPRPAKAHFLEGADDGRFSWNALRFPWRLSLDYLETGDPRARAHLQRINGWIQGATRGDPQRIANTYRLNGRGVGRAGKGSAAFIAMFAASAVAGSGKPEADQAWSDALWQALNAVPLEDADYYGNTLKLLAMIALAEQGPHR